MLVPLRQQQKILTISHNLVLSVKAIVSNDPKKLKGVAFPSKQQVSFRRQ